MEINDLLHDFNHIGDSGGDRIVHLGVNQNDNHRVLRAGYQYCVQVHRPRKVFHRRFQGQVVCRDY